MHQSIVYIMNVDWDWAKQRPHFLAEHLAKSFDLVILYPYSWRRAHLAKNKCAGLKMYPFFRLPFGGKFAFIRKWNLLILRVLGGIFLKCFPSDFVWISSPELFAYLPKRLSPRLIYDCMDDVLAFPTNESCKEILAANEMALIESSVHIFCSSLNLRDKLILRTGYNNKFSVVHNAFEPSSFLNFSANNEAKTQTDRFVLGYVGTISSWMDFAALFEIVKTFPSVEIHLLGPIENLGCARPEHERIKYLGPVRHEEIPFRVADFDALFMPFKVTELILSVDPVKLYEYIFFDKPILSVWYPEVDRFSDFVDFYTSHEKLISYLSGYVSGISRKKYSGEARSRFIAANTWALRATCIENKLKNI